MGRGADTYTTNWAFDSNFSSSSYSFGNPISQSSSSSLGGGTRSTTTTYEHNTTKWILGLPLEQTTNGKPLVQLDYDANGNVVEYSRVGVRKATLSYNAQGLVTSYTDAVNRQTTINGYHRGIPTSLTRPDGVTVTRTIDDNGWVTGQTDGNGVTTGFSHNVMGWLTGIDRVSPWSDTAISYSGLGAGVVQTSTRGNLQTVTTYDRYHRPVTTQQADLTGHSSTVFNTFQYDGLGRTIFTSLPSFAAGSTPGVATTYDGLGRILSETMTADNTVTAYSYGANNTVSVTDPEGHTTTTTSSGYGSPDDGNPISIVQPEGVTTTMTYDIWGNLTSATQGGGGVSQWQHWWYDNELRVCRHTDKPTGSTLFAYNNADEMVAYVEGQPWQSGCVTSLPSQGLVTHQFDLMGRLKRIGYPSGTPSRNYRYDNNGNLTRLGTGGRVWTYSYNSANLPDWEQFDTDGRTYVNDLYYNADEALTDRVTPGGRVVNYNPDGFGRPKRARVNGFDYARNAQYHPSGALERFRYGNNAIRDADFNARHEMTDLTVTRSGTTIIDYAYGRDDNGRITAITDHVQSGQNRSFSYDGLGRLVEADGPWGQGAYTYDAVGNILTRQLGARTVEMEYNYTMNRLNRYRDSAASGNAWQSIQYDPRGNITGTGRASMGYDYTNRPTSLSNPVSGTYRYDGHGRRAKQIVDG
ncbi:MAG: hypothetical protein AAF829_11130, partial [Pseudomonadota bacterium]